MYARRPVKRLKYEGFGRMVLGRALLRSGRHDDALEQLRLAVDVADRLGSPPELLDPIATIRDWAVAHMERVITARDMYDASSGASNPANSPNPVVPAATPW